MENENENIIPQEDASRGYVPRPKWQVWAARIGVVIMIISFLLYCYQIATGGM